MKSRKKRNGAPWERTLWWGPRWKTGIKRVMKTRLKTRDSRVYPPTGNSLFTVIRTNIQQCHHKVIAMQLQLITQSLIFMQSFSHIGFFFMPVDKHSWLIKKKFVNEFLSSLFLFCDKHVDYFSGSPCLWILEPLLGINKIYHNKVSRNFKISHQYKIKKRNKENI